MKWADERSLGGGSGSSSPCGTDCVHALGGKASPFAKLAAAAGLLGSNYWPTPID